MKKEHGLWISIDGLDAVGKTTQVDLVVKQLNERGINSVGIEEFSSSPVGQTIQEILSRNRFYSLREDKKTPLADTLLLVTDLVYETEARILPTVNSGGIIVSDRGPASLIAYQAVRIAERSDLNLNEAIKWCKKALSQIPIIPDLIALIMVSEDEMARRVQQRENSPLSQDDLTFLHKVNKTLPSIANNLSQRCVLIDGEKKPSEVTDNIINSILPRNI